MFETADKRLPFIPEPDYWTIRYKPRTNEQRRLQLKDDHGQPHHYQPQVRQQVRHSSIIDEEPEEEPRTQSPDEVKRRVLRMLKEHGVPVFPTGGPTEIVENANHAALGPTRAYIKHLENHRKYDTLNSFRSCDTCALCKQMQEEITILKHGVPQRKRPSQQPMREQRKDPLHQPRSREQPERRTPKTRSELISGRLFEPLREEEAEVVELMPEPTESADLVTARIPTVHSASSRPQHANEWNRHKSSLDTHTSHSTASPPEQRRRIVRVPEARAKRQFAAATSQQLSVRADERVKVIQIDTIWSLCTRVDGQIGWVPTNNLMFESGSSLGSSPLLN